MDFSRINANYYVVFGKCDACDAIDWDIELDEKQQKLFKKAVMTQTPLEEVSELAELLDKAYSEIEEMEIANGIDYEDEYVLECLGEAEVDPYEINDLVHDGDEHAIAFFGLEDLSEEELEEWDASDLDELPLIKDFEEDFEPSSPYDCGWDLRVNFPGIDEFEIESEDIEEYIRELKECGDIEMINKVVDAWSLDYESDEFDSLEEFVESL